MTQLTYLLPPHPLRRRTDRAYCHRAWHPFNNYVLTAEDSMSAPAQGRRPALVLSEGRHSRPRAHDHWCSSLMEAPDTVS